MPCLIGCLALLFPRLAIVLVWLFSPYLQTAFQGVHFVWPVLGFFLMPLTVLAYTLAWHIQPRGSIDGFGVVVVVLAVLIDLGIIGGGASNRRVRGYYSSRR